MPYYVDMYVARASWPSSNGKSYQSIYLRESYRDGPRVRKRDIANLTHCDPKANGESPGPTVERRHSP
jgi:transposase